MTGQKFALIVRILVARKRSAIVLLLPAARRYGKRSLINFKYTRDLRHVVKICDVRACCTVGNDKVQHVGYASRFGDGSDLLIRVERKRMSGKKTAFVIRILVARKRSTVVFLFRAPRRYGKRPRIHFEYTRDLRYVVKICDVRAGDRINDTDIQIVIGDADLRPR